MSLNKVTIKSIMKNIALIVFLIITGIIYPTVILAVVQILILVLVTAKIRSFCRDYKKGKPVIRVYTYLNKEKENMLSLNHKGFWTHFCLTEKPVLLSDHMDLIKATITHEEELSEILNNMTDEEKESIMKAGEKEK